MSEQSSGHHASTGAVDQKPDTLDTAALMARRKSRNTMIAWSLVGFIVLVFVVTIVKLQQATGGAG